MSDFEEENNHSNSSSSTTSSQQKTIVVTSQQRIQKKSLENVKINPSLNTMSVNSIIYGDPSKYNKKILIPIHQSQAKQLSVDKIILNNEKSNHDNIQESMIFQPIKRAMTSAERQKAYRKRKKLLTENPIKTKVPKTPAERQKAYRERKKMLLANRQSIPNSCNISYN